MARIVASISGVKASFGVSYNIPVSEVSYILIFAEALLDNTGLYRYTVDSVVSTDGTRLHLGKAFEDAVSSSDQLKAKQVAKGVKDTISFQDVLIRTLIFFRTFTELQSLSDTQKFQTSKVFADLFGFTDVSSRTLGKVTADNFGLTDAQVRSVLKNLTDTPTITDAKQYSLSTVKTDSVAGIDTAAKATTKQTVDSFGTSDVLVRSISRYLADTFALNDSTGIGDGIAYQAIKTIRNVAIATDAESYTLNKRLLRDASAMLDSGSLINQGYCDLTYFSADYVGSSRQF